MARSLGARVALPPRDGCPLHLRRAARRHRHRLRRAPARRRSRPTSTSSRPRSTPPTSARSCRRSTIRATSAALAGARRRARRRADRSARRPRPPRARGAAATSSARSCSWPAPRRSRSARTSTWRTASSRRTASRRPPTWLPGELPAELPFPVLVKARRGFGSRHIYRAEDREELDFFLAPHDGRVDGAAGLRRRGVLDRRLLRPRRPLPRRGPAHDDRVEGRRVDQGDDDQATRS